MNNASSHTLQSIRFIPWIASLGEVANSGKDWRRGCNVKYCCANKGRASKFCIQCTFITYLGDSPFMVCASKSCLLKHKEPVGHHCSGAKRFKMESARQEKMQERAKAKEDKKAKVQPLKDAMNLELKKQKEQAKRKFRELKAKLQ